MWRYVFLFGALIGAFYGIADRDAVLAAMMGGSFGFQMALWLVDREQSRKLRKMKRLRLHLFDS